MKHHTINLIRLLIIWASLGIDATAQSRISATPIRVVPNLAALDALPPSVDAPIVEVLGFSTPKDWGEEPRRFVYDRTNALSTNAIRRAVVGGVGRWIHYWDGNVKVFGAKGDGTIGWFGSVGGSPTPTDDTTAIRSALDYGAKNGIPVKFPPGFYRITSTIEITNLIAPHIIGYNRKWSANGDNPNQSVMPQTVLVCDFTTGPMMVFQGKKTASYPAVQTQDGFQKESIIENIQIAVRGATQSTNALVVLKRSAQARWHNVELFGGSRHLDLFEAHDFIARDCRFLYGGWGGTNPVVTVHRTATIPGEDTYTLNNYVKFDTCVWELCYSMGLLAGPPGQANNVANLILYNCHFKLPYHFAQATNQMRISNTKGLEVQNIMVACNYSSLTSSNQSLSEVVYLDTLYSSRFHGLLDLGPSSGKVSITNFVRIANSKAVDLNLVVERDALAGESLISQNHVAVVNCTDVSVNGVKNDSTARIWEGPVVHTIPHVFRTTNNFTADDALAYGTLIQRNMLLTNSRSGVLGALVISNVVTTTGDGALTNTGASSVGTLGYSRFSGPVREAVGEAQFVDVGSGLSTIAIGYSPRGVFQGGGLHGGFISYNIPTPQMFGGATAYGMYGLYAPSTLKVTGVSYAWPIYLGAADDTSYINGRVGIGTAFPLSSAALEISSTSRFFYPPRMTEAQKGAVTPANGATVFSTDMGWPQFYSGSTWWTNMSQANGYYTVQGTTPVAQITAEDGVSGQIYNIIGTSNAILRVRANGSPMFTVLSNNVTAGGTNGSISFFDGTTMRQIRIGGAGSGPGGVGRALFID